MNDQSRQAETNVANQPGASGEASSLVRVTDSACPDCGKPMIWTAAVDCPVRRDRDHGEEEITRLQRRGRTFEAQLAALREIGATVVLAPCTDCGQEWPHPSVLSSFPRCESCWQAQLAALRGELEQWKQDAEQHLCRANEEIARRERVEIAYTQSEQKRLALIDRAEAAEQLSLVERDALKAAVESLKAKLAASEGEGR